MNSLDFSFVICHNSFRFPRNRGRATASRFRDHGPQFIPTGFIPTGFISTKFIPTKFIPTKFSPPSFPHQVFFRHVFSGTFFPTTFFPLLCFPPRYSRKVILQPAAVLLSFLFLRKDSVSASIRSAALL